MHHCDDCVALRARWGAQAGGHNGGGHPLESESDYNLVFSDILCPSLIVSVNLPQCHRPQATVLLQSSIPIIRQATGLQSSD